MALSNAQIISAVAAAAIETNLDLYEVWVGRGLKAVYKFRLNDKEIVAFFLFDRRISESEMVQELVKAFKEPAHLLTGSPFSEYQ